MNPRLKTAGRKRKLSVETLEVRVTPAANPIVAENLLPGNPESEWMVSGDGDTTLQGFSTDISVNHGQTVSFKITDTAQAPYHIDIYRLGYYQGNGARKVATIPSSQTARTVQPAPLFDSTTNLVDAGNWSVAASWAVPSTATSGLYIARLVREDTGGASLIFFVVRDDGGHSDLLFQTSDSTWEAYNHWGGESVYQGTDGDFDDRAVKVSYNRPLTLAGVSGGFGSYNSPLHSEYPMIRWLESNGYNVSYSTDVDSARNGALIQTHKVFMSVGHDEYWSGQQRANVEAARDAGVNLAFFSGNEVFWKTRWETSIDGSATDYRTLVTYKESKDNARTDPMDLSSGIWTGTWRDARFSPPADGGRPENALSGTMYMNDRTNVDIGIPMQVPSDYSALRFWRNTSIASLQPGQVATIGDRVIGYETDEDVDNGFRPAGLFDLSSTTFSTNSHVQDSAGVTVAPGTSTHQMTLYRASSGALVFGAGTVQWSWGLDGHHIDGSGTPDLNIQQATLNLLADMGSQPSSMQPGLVAATMSTDLTRPTSTITSPTSGTFTTGAPITITGTAADAGGGVVAGVEVSTDGGRTWHKATGRGNWTYTWTPVSTGPATLLSRASDDSGNVQLATGGIAVSVISAPTSPTGLVAAFDFNAGSGTNLADRAGTNNGTISNATWTSSGMFGSGALSFNGTNSWVTVPDSSSLDLTSALTMEAWVNPTAATGFGSVLFKERTGGDNYALYAVNGAGLPPAAYLNVGSGVENSLQGSTALPLNTWSHVAATYNGSLLSLYVNGNLVGTKLVSGALTTSSGVLRIGGNSLFGDYFKGLIDEVRIYNRALNQGEIRTDMSTPIGGALETTPPTVTVGTPSTTGTTTTFTATAADNVAVAGVQFMLNGQPIGAEVTSAVNGQFQLQMSTSSLPSGTQNVTARARDVAGNVTTSSSTPYTVVKPIDTIAPSVAVTNLSPNTTVGGIVVLSAVSTDDTGVVGVQFQVNGTNIGSEVTTAPFEVLWNTAPLPSGSYTIAAVSRDATGNVTTSASVPVTVDSTPPAVASQSPAANATQVATSINPSVTFSEPIIPSALSMVLKDASGNVLNGTVSYDPVSQTATLFYPPALAVSATYTVVVTGATDLSGNRMADCSWSFTTQSTITGATIWTASATPAIPAASDSNAQEVGVKFQSSVAGSITGLRFYKGAGNTGTHVGHLWAADGTLLATATFANETATGWQEVTLSAPVAIQANTTYVASYYAPAGHYAFTGAGLATRVSNGSLLALSSTEAGGNGVFRLGTGGGFPNQTYNSANYWVDVVFNASGNSSGDTVPPAVAGQAPAAGATGVPAGSVVTATFTEPVQANTIAFVLKDSAGNTVPAAVTYNSATYTVTLTPNTPLATNTTYTATVSGALDLGGNVMTAPVSWSFSTPTLLTNATLWPSSTTPAVASWNDSASQELGVRFYSDISGYVSGVRFYKGTGNTGTHTGSLWANDGTLLATATFANESASGWQMVTFSSPVAIQANTLYVVSYYAPAGNYAVSSKYFATTGVDSGPLHAPPDGSNGGNGLYKLGVGGGFPGNSYNSNNYWVDVLFSQTTSDTTAPTVTGVTPADTAQGVLPSATLTVAFSEAVVQSSIALDVRDAAGNPVPGNLSYDGGTKTATFVPVTPLLSFASYSATLTAAKDLSGNSLAAPYAWSFRVQGVWTQSTADDFSTGTTAGTVITNMAGGEIQLAPLLTDDFSGSSLSSPQWTTISWTASGGGQTSITTSGGILSVGGGAIFSAQGYVNTAVEGRIAFGAVANQHFGLATGLSTVAGNYWAIFSTKSTTNHLYARVNSSGTTTDVDLGALPSGFHVYRVTPTGTGFQFYVDDVLKTTINASFQNTQALKVALSAFSGAPQAPVQADWVHFLSFSTTQSGTFTSGVLDVGQTVDWGTASWTADLPTGTSIKVETMSSTDGGTWTDWQEVTNGVIASPNGRYLRYRITLTTTSGSVTPVFRDIRLTWA